jgi:cytochrome c-type biogenesis protein CcmH
VKQLILALAFVAGAAGAVLPDEQLPDPALEARARAISKELRCVVCQNQSIDDSDAPLARDLRVIVREQITAGKTDDQVMSYVVERYGNFVLMKPPFQLGTALLWLGPLLVTIVGAIGAMMYVRGRKAAAAEPAPLTPEEQARVDALLRESEVR